MNKSNLRIADYLAHILQAIDRIHHYTEDIAEPEFLENEMIQDAVISLPAYKKRHLHHAPLSISTNHE